MRLPLPPCPAWSPTAPATGPHTQPRLRWDIFCHVIDNWGDLGVCWRLCADLARRGQTVRLWADHAQPLQWMAPGALEGRWPGVSVHTWDRHPDAAPPPQTPAADVLIEAFGCHVAPAWVAQLLPATAPQPPVWINLEYLSAEPYVQRCHGLPSPVLSGPLSGRCKWFFYPGFTADTGGLLREPGAMPDPTELPPEPLHAGAPDAAPRLTLFCYEPERLGELLQHPDLARAHWQVAAGRSASAFNAVCHALPKTAQHTALPHLSHSAFDEVLCHSDLNWVRGEDSLVRALWAGQALVWQIYPQDDGAHHAKLQAFLDWFDAPEDLRLLHACHNGLSHAPWPRLDPATLQRWRRTTQAARARLWAQPDLCTQLMDFVHTRRITPHR